MRWFLALLLVLAVTMPVTSPAQQTGVGGSVKQRESEQEQQQRQQREEVQRSEQEQTQLQQLRNAQESLTRLRSLSVRLSEQDVQTVTQTATKDQAFTRSLKLADIPYAPVQDLVSFVDGMRLALGNARRMVLGSYQNDNAFVALGKHFGVDPAQQKLQGWSVNTAKRSMSVSNDPVLCQMKYERLLAARLGMDPITTALKGGEIAALNDYNMKMFKKLRRVGDANAMSGRGLFDDMQGMPPGVQAYGLKMQAINKYQEYGLSRERADINAKAHMAKAEAGYVQVMDLVEPGPFFERLGLLAVELTPVGDQEAFQNLVLTSDSPSNLQGSWQATAFPGLALVALAEVQRDQVQVSTQAVPLEEANDIDQLPPDKKRTALKALARRMLDSRQKCAPLLVPVLVLQAAYLDAMADQADMDQPVAQYFILMEVVYAVQGKKLLLVLSPGAMQALYSPRVALPAVATRAEDSFYSTVALAGVLDDPTVGLLAEDEIRALGDRVHVVDPNTVIKSIPPAALIFDQAAGKVRNKDLTITTTDGKRLDQALQHVTSKDRSQEMGKRFELALSNAQSRQDSINVARLRTAALALSRGKITAQEFANEVNAGVGTGGQ